MHTTAAWTPGRRSPRAPPRAPRIELSRLNPRSATSTAPTTITGGGFAVGCVLRRNGIGRRRRSPRARAHLHACTPTHIELASIRTSPSRPPRRRASVNSKTGRRLPRKEHNSRSLRLDVAELDFDARMKAASFSVEYTQSASVRKNTVTRAHVPGSIDACVDTRFMVGSASYARQHTGSHRIALGTFAEAVNNQNVVLVESSRLGTA